MDNPQEPEGSAQRQLARRHHRILGLYLAVVAWSNNLDAIVFDRISFTRFLSLERVRKARILQFESDIVDWFPYVRPFYSGDSLHTLYLSRKEFIGSALNNKLRTCDRVGLLRKGGISISAFSDIKKNIVNLSEQDIVSFVALLSSGLETPIRGDSGISRRESLENALQRLRNARTISRTDQST